MEFIFKATEYDEISFKSQVSKALEIRTELLSRKEHPKLWKFVDKLNSKEKAPEEVLKKRYVRYKVYGAVLVFLGLFILIPSVVRINEMLIPLLWSIFAIGLGLFYFSYGKRSKKVKRTSFDKAAEKLYNGYKDIPSIKFIFTEDNIKLEGTSIINYSDIEKFFISEDLFIIIWDERITVIQKKDLSSGNLEEFIDFIKSKSQDLFEIVNII